MRDPKTYRAFRRNEPGNFVRVDGANWNKPFAAEATYKTPSKKERYLANRLRKLGTQTEVVVPEDAALD
jgi:hypothetical protein